MCELNSRTEGSRIVKSKLCILPLLKKTSTSMKNVINFVTWWQFLCSKLVTKIKYGDQLCELRVPLNTISQAYTKVQAVQATHITAQCTYTQRVSCFKKCITSAYVLVSFIAVANGFLSARVRIELHSEEFSPKASESL